MKLNIVLNTSNPCAQSPVQTGDGLPSPLSLVVEADCSKGCDNMVWLLNLHGSTGAAANTAASVTAAQRVVLRAPRKAAAAQPHAGHRPGVQAWLYDRLAEACALVHLPSRMCFSLLGLVLV